MNIEFIIQIPFKLFITHLIINYFIKDMAKEKPKKTLEEKLSEAANYSLPAHLM